MLYFNYLRKLAKKSYQFKGFSKSVCKENKTIFLDYKIEQCCVQCFLVRRTRKIWIYPFRSRNYYLAYTYFNIRITLATLRNGDDSSKNFIYMYVVLSDLSSRQKRDSCLNKTLKIWGSKRWKWSKISRYLSFSLSFRRPIHHYKFNKRRHIDLRDSISLFSISSRILHRSSFVAFRPASNLNLLRATACINQRIIGF